MIRRTGDLENGAQAPELRAARAVIVDDDGRFAILEVRGGEYFKIPGGGMEVGETAEQAARRESLEEAGVEIELLGRLSEHTFHEQHPEKGLLIHRSVCFLARVVGNKQETAFSDWEQRRNFTLHWWDYETALQRFDSAKPANFFGAQINPRDRAYLVEGKALLDAKRGGAI